jgi:transcriptional regulator with XRE-family HTH domain
LQWLRELKTPRGEQPPSYEATARLIFERTGVSMSGAYFWELATGRTTNPKLHHLQSMARYFNVPVAYLSDDEADFTQLETELELLRALKHRGVQHIKLQGTTGISGIAEESADLATVQGLLGRLRQLDISGDEGGDDWLPALEPDQRDALRKVVSEPVMLKALGDARLRELIRGAAGLAEERLAVAVAVVGQPELLDALRTETVREITRRASGLSEASHRAVLALVEHLREVEESAQPR